MVSFNKKDKNISFIGENFVPSNKWKRSNLICHFYYSCILHFSESLSLVYKRFIVMELNLTNGHIVVGLGLQNLELFSRVCVFLFWGGRGKVFFLRCFVFVLCTSTIRFNSMPCDINVRFRMMCSNECTMQWIPIVNTGLRF